MNYIKQLEHDLIVMRKALEAYDTEIDDLVRYLTSAKFHEDPTVQVQDVLNRISAGRMTLTYVLDKLVRPTHPTEVP
jgi:hypothetical protein